MCLQNFDKLKTFLLANKVRFYMYTLKSRGKLKVLKLIAIGIDEDEVLNELKEKI